MDQNANYDVNNAISGVVVVDKPVGLTSHEVVQIIRKGTNIRRAGHTGTLDPRASGVLVVLIGPAVRLSEYVSASDKRYQAIIRLGTTTDTYDTEGQVLKSSMLTSQNSNSKKPSRRSLARSNRFRRPIRRSRSMAARLTRWHARVRKWNCSPARSSFTAWNCWNGRHRTWSSMCTARRGRTCAPWHMTWARNWAAALR